MPGGVDGGDADGVERDLRGVDVAAQELGPGAELMRLGIDAEVVDRRVFDLGELDGGPLALPPLVEELTVVDAFVDRQRGTKAPDAREDEIDLQLEPPSGLGLGLGLGLGRSRPRFPP